jgi:hypothetical protein
MKKLSITLLALALALVFTVPAMAIHLGNTESPEGSLGINGKYQFDGEVNDVDGTTTDYFDDDLDIGLVWVKGDIRALVGLEISDMNPWEGSASSETTRSQRSQIVDNYYVEWSAMDNLKLKIGEYGLAFGRNIGTYLAGARQIQLTYSLDALDITGALIKNNDFANADTVEIGLGAESDMDNDELYIKITGKQNGPFTKLALASYTQMNDVGNENSYMGLDLALPIGPVDLAFEYGANGGDLDGTFMLLLTTINLANIDFGLNYFISSDDYLSPYDGNDWSPAMILGDNINGTVADMSTIWVTAMFDVNDKLTIGGGAVVAAENDAGDEYGTEVDAVLMYQIADNVSYKLAYGSYSEGDGVASGDVDTTELFQRIQFTW